MLARWYGLARFNAGNHNTRRGRNLSRATQRILPNLQVRKGACPEAFSKKTRVSILNKLLAPAGLCHIWRRRHNDAPPVYTTSRRWILSMLTLQKPAGDETFAAPLAVLKEWCAVKACFQLAYSTPKQSPALARDGHYCSSKGTASIRTQVTGRRRVCGKSRAAYLASSSDSNVEEVQPLACTVFPLDVAAQEVHHHVGVIPQAIR